MCGNQEAGAGGPDQDGPRSCGGGDLQWASRSRNVRNVESRSLRSLPADIITYYDIIPCAAGFVWSGVRDGNCIMLGREAA
mgnify:CR=1 FL=1